MKRTDAYRNRRLWTVIGVAAVVLIVIWSFQVYDRQTAEAADSRTLQSPAQPPLVTMAPAAPATDGAGATWPDSGPVTDPVTLVTAKTPQTLVGLPVHARGFAVQAVLDAKRFTVGPPDQQALVKLPRRADNPLAIHPGQIVTIRGEVQRAADGSLFIAATSVEIERRA